MNSNAAHKMNKRSILTRMQRFAANALGVKRIELLDPLVSLFIESLAEEIYKLSVEIDNIESRMLDSLSAMLCSDISLSAHPAHCILHATPSENELVLSKETPFILSDKRHLPEGQSNLTFYPVCNTRIRKGGIRYVIHNGLCYRVNADHTKTLVSRSRSSEFAQKKSCWIALELDDSIETLKGLSFYFDFSEISNKREYLHMLPFMTWQMNGKTINLKQGLHTIDNDSGNEAVKLFDNFDTSENIDRSIFDSYFNRFLSVTDDFNILTEKRTFPQELAGYFQSHFTDDFVHPLIWFEIAYPAKYPTAVIDAMTVSINAFPVANKVFHSRMVDVTGFLPIAPLNTGNHESLLSVRSVTDLSGKQYYDLPFEDTEEEQYRTYSLRRGGYERYGKRDVREYLLNLGNLLENHSSVKTGNSTDNNEMEAALAQVHNLVKQIRKVVLKTTKRLEVQNYLLFDSQNEDDTFFIKYWTTHCSRANNIKQHTALDCISAEMPVDASSIHTLSATTGGKYAPRASEQQNLRSKSLIESSVLVTNDDIVRYCEENFGNLISGISVRKGIEKDWVKNQGFICTTDIILTPKKESDYVINESDAAVFKQLLQKNSPATYNYRIYINNKN